MYMAGRVSSNWTSRPRQFGLDGLYVIRTSMVAGQLDAATTVAAYKSMDNVERTFRSMKTVDLHVSPARYFTKSPSACAPTSSFACAPTAGPARSPHTFSTCARESALTLQAQLRPA